jgi:amicyanin
MQHKGLIIGIAAVIVVLAVVAGVAVNHKSNDSSMNNMNMDNQASQESTQQAKQPKTSSAVETTSVAISNFAFSPAVIKVKVGQAVTWTNNDAVAHTVTADSSSSYAPNSELINKGETYSFTFTKAGTYAYHCTPHPYMKGTIVVE